MSTEQIFVRLRSVTKQSVGAMIAPGHGMEWNGNFGMEYGRCQNGMEWKISRMEWKAILHISIPIPY